jgi:hypothetical protein
MMLHRIAYSETAAHCGGLVGGLDMGSVYVCIDCTDIVCWDLHSPRVFSASTSPRLWLATISQS